MAAFRAIAMVVVVAALVCGAVRQAAAADETGDADQRALRAACQSYVKAVNSGDVNAVVAHWTEDADYVSDSGEKIQGRAALTKLFRDHLPAMQGKKFSFEPESLRTIAPGVAIEDGVAKFSGGDEDEKHAGTRYSAVWVRNGDKWLISSVRDLGDVPTEEQAAAPLKQLDWLVGDWQHSGDKADVELNCAWVLEDQFLKQKYEVKPKDGPSFTVVTMVGWDPVEQQLRSWFFDSRGGFGNGVWQRDGSTWTIHSQGVISGGRIGEATNIWKFADENTAVWTSKDRHLDGIPMPETEVKFGRKAPVGAQ